MKYLELVESSFAQEHFDKQLNQRPYVAYSIKDDKVIYNIILKPAYVIFTAEEDNSSIGLEKLSTYQTLEYSTDTINWNTFGRTTNISLNNEDKVYVRGVLRADNTSSNYTQFKMGGKISASGNCNSIWNYQDLNAPLKAYCGRVMFRGCTALTTVPELPATTLAEGCYLCMFEGCTSISNAPKLPATTLANKCYQSMFKGCTSLTEAPVLPATELSEYCYGYMFSGCTSLTTAPELPATTLAKYCYKLMFQGCTSLTKVPDELPATILADGCYSGMFQSCSLLASSPKLPAMTLASSCYYEMFYQCSSLTTAPELPATTLANYCYYWMFHGCTSLTKAPELPAMTLANYCYNAMFSNCRLTQAPKLPATTLTNHCYYQMFLDCSNLTQAPDLPATTLVNSCYARMFEGCTNLNYIKCLATDISAENCTHFWFYRGSSTGTFIKHHDAVWPRGLVGIPTNWVVEDAEIEYLLIDLGLPSGIKWADRNVGAENPWDNGLYFSWGNVNGHTVDENGNVTDGYSFDSLTYSSTSGGQYTGSTLDSEHDAAKQNWGGDWRMPTVDETRELVQNTDHYYIGEDGSIVAGPFNHTTKYSDKGLDGSKLRSICFVKQGEDFNYDNRTNFIEFPFAGYCKGSLLSYDGLREYVWSSSVSDNNELYALYLYFVSTCHLYGDNGHYRYYGRSVRGVKNN